MNALEKELTDLMAYCKQASEEADEVQGKATGDIHRDYFGIVKRMTVRLGVPLPSWVAKEGE